MNRRQFIGASLAGVIAAPLERERVYSFGRDPGRVMLANCSVEIVSPSHGSRVADTNLCMVHNFLDGRCAWEARMGLHFTGNFLRNVSGLPSPAIPGDGNVLFGEPITRGILLLKHNQYLTSADIARELRRQKAALDARGVWC